MEHNLGLEHKKIHSEVNVIGYVSTANKNKTKTKKIREYSSTTLGYLHSRKGSRKPKHLRHLRILFDSGCSHAIINQAVTQGITKNTNKKANGKQKAEPLKQLKHTKLFLTYYFSINIEI